MEKRSVRTFDQYINCTLYCIGPSSAIRPELAFSRAEHSLPYPDVTIYIYIYIFVIFIVYALRVSIFMTSPLGVADGLMSI